jgi:hypothetical protein
MKRIRNLVLSLLGVTIMTVGIFPTSAFASYEDFTESAEITLQYEEPTTYTLSIPSVIDITSGNCISLSNANIASDKEVYVNVCQSSFNDNGGITMTQTNGSTDTINVTLYNHLNQPLSTSNPLLCVFNETEPSGYSTFFYGECQTTNVMAGKYRATVEIEVGVRDYQKDE